MTPDTLSFGASVLDFPPIFSMYIPDPYNGSILNPQDCYIEFPRWQDPYYSPKTPKNWKWDEFYFPPIPPIRPRENNENYDEALKGVFKKLREFSQTKDGLKFRLELAGFGKEHVSVSINECKNLIVSARNDAMSYNKNFPIPSPENYNLSNPTAKMENGLLEISFAAKKEEVRAIKIL